MNEKIIIIITCKTGGQGNFIVITEKQVIGMKKRKRVGHKKVSLL